MASRRLSNYLRAYRKRAGLTQRDVALLLGNSDGAQLSRYEKQHRIPPLETAIAFEVIYKAPVAELFAGLHDSVAAAVRKRTHEFALKCQEESVSDNITSSKLRWLAERDSENDTISCTG